MSEAPDDISVDDGSAGGGDSSSFFDELSSTFNTAENELFSAAASVRASLTGVTRDDIANGVVDPATLSRAQRAQLFIDGSTGGPAPNPWTVGTDLDSGTVAEILGGGGGVLVFDVDIAAPLAALDKLLPPRFALLWDDQQIAAQGSVPVNALSSSSLVAEVTLPPAGRQLTLWVDSTMTATFRKLSPRGTLDAVIAAEKKTQTDADPLSRALDAVDGAVNKFFDVEAGVGLALVVVVGVALFLFIESGGPGQVAGAMRQGAV